MENIRLYILESYNELINKVTWPTWSQLQNTTVVVIIGSIILTILIFIMDLVSKGATGILYDLPF